MATNRFKVRAEVPNGKAPHTFSIMSSVSFAFLQNHLKVISDLSQIVVTYQDDEGDEVTLTNEEEFTEAKRSLDFENILTLQLTVTAGPNATPYKKEDSDTSAAKLQPTPRSGNNTGKTRKTGYYPKLAEELGEMIHPSAPQELAPMEHAAMSRNTQTTPDLTNTPSEWTDSFLSTASKEITNVLDSLLKSVTAEPSSLMRTSSNTLCHTGILCKVCSKTIIGNRYKCGNCVEFDICELCLLNPDAHDPTHILMLIRLPCPSAGYKEGKPVPMLKDNIYQPSNHNDDEEFRELSVEDLDWRARKSFKKEWKRGEKKNKKMLPQHVETQVEALRSDIDSKKKEIKEIRGRIRSTKKHGMEEGITTEIPTQELSARVIRDKGECVSVTPLTRVSCKWLVENNGESFWSSVRFHCVSGNLFSDERQISLPFCSQGDQIELEVPFTAPENQGYYYSHWRLSHRGKAFGPPFKAECRVEYVLLSDKNVEVDSGAEDDEDLASADQGFAIKAFPGAGGMQQPLIAISREDYMEDLVSLQAMPTEDNDSIDLDATELIQEDRNSPLFSDQDFLPDLIVNATASPPVDIITTRLMSNLDTASVASSSADSFIVVQMPESFDPDKIMYLSQGSRSIPVNIEPEVANEHIREDSTELSPLSSIELLSSPVPSPPQSVFHTHSPQPNVSVASLSSFSPMSSIKSFVSSVVDKLDDSLTRSLTPKVQLQEEFISSYEDFKPVEFKFSDTTSVTQDYYTAPLDPSTPTLSTSQTVNISPPLSDFKFEVSPAECFMVPSTNTTSFEAKPLLSEDADMWLSQSSGTACNMENDKAKWIASKDVGFSLTSDEEAWIAPSSNWKPREPSTPLERLMKMGFCNRDLNIKLLERFNYKLEFVIAALIDDSQAAWVNN